MLKKSMITTFIKNQTIRTIWASVLRASQSLGIHYEVRSGTNKQWLPHHLAAQIIHGVPRQSVEVSPSDHLQTVQDLEDASGRIPAL